MCYTQPLLVLRHCYYCASIDELRDIFLFARTRLISPPPARWQTHYCYLPHDCSHCDDLFLRLRDCHDSNTFHLALMSGSSSPSSSRWPPPLSTVFVCIQ